MIDASSSSSSPAWRVCICGVRGDVLFCFVLGGAHTSFQESPCCLAKSFRKQPSPRAKYPPFGETLQWWKTIVQNGWGWRLRWKTGDHIEALIIWGSRSRLGFSRIWPRRLQPPCLEVELNGWRNQWNETWLTPPYQGCDSIVCYLLTVTGAPPLKLVSHPPPPYGVNVFLRDCSNKGLSIRTDWNELIRSILTEMNKAVNFRMAFWEQGNILNRI